MEEHWKKINFPLDDKRTKSGQTTLPNSSRNGKQNDNRPNNKSTRVIRSKKTYGNENNTFNNKSHGNDQTIKSKVNNQGANRRGSYKGSAQSIKSKSNNENTNQNKFFVQKFVDKHEYKYKPQVEHRGRNRSGQYRSFHSVNNAPANSNPIPGLFDSPVNLSFKSNSPESSNTIPKLVPEPKSSNKDYEGWFESPPRLFDGRTFNSNQDRHQGSKLDRPRTTFVKSKPEVDKSENDFRHNKFTQSEQKHDINQKSMTGAMAPSISGSSVDGSCEGDDRSDKYSQCRSLCDSVLSFDRDPEINILNQIHILKTTLHSMESKPSIHVFNEIKGFKDYIDLIIDKWNPKKIDTNLLGSDTESILKFQQTKKIKEENMKQNVKAEEKEVATENYMEVEATADRIAETDQKENSKECLNSNTVSSDSQRPSNQNIYSSDKSSQNSSSTQASLSNQREINKNYPRSNNSRKNKNKNQNSAKGTPSGLTTDSSPKPKRTAVDNIIQQIRLSTISMSKDELCTMKTELEKFQTNHFGLDKFNENMKCITLCLVKLIENSTISYELVDKILELLERYLVEVSGEENIIVIENLMAAYRESLDTLKNETKDYSAAENYVNNIKDLQANKNIFNDILNFQENVISDINVAFIDDTEEELTSDAADETSSSEESDSSNKEGDQKEEVIVRPRWSDTKRLNNLTVHCLSFIESEDSILKQVDNLIIKFNLSQSAGFKNRERKVILHIRESLKQMYPKHVLYVFGSRGSNMALPDSDFDIYIDVTGDGYYSGTDYETQQMYVKKIKKQFFRNPSLFSTIFGLAKTKVPIIKIHHTPTSLNCDISFKNGISVENTFLLKYYLSIDGNVTWLVAAVKLWAHYNDLYGSSYFTSHALNWLVLFYLMQVHVVPPVIALKSPTTKKIIDGWDVSFVINNKWQPARLHPLSLFKGFFRFLTSVDFKTNFLCTLTGEFIPKVALDNVEFVQQYRDGVFNEWYKRIEMNKQLQLTARQDPSSVAITMEENALCIQDPFEFSKNISTPVKLTKFKQFLRQSHLTHTQLNAVLPLH